MKKNIEKKWCEWYEGGDYQQVIYVSFEKMVQEWCKVGAVVLSIGVGFREGKGGNLLLNWFSGVNVAFVVQ